MHLRNTALLICLLILTPVIIIDFAAGREEGNVPDIVQPGGVFNLPRFANMEDGDMYLYFRAGGWTNDPDLEIYYYKNQNYFVFSKYQTKNSFRNRHSMMVDLRQHFKQEHESNRIRNNAGNLLKLINEFDIDNFHDTIKAPVELDENASYIILVKKNNDKYQSLVASLEATLIQDAAMEEIFTITNDTWSIMHAYHAPVDRQSPDASVDSSSSQCKND